MSIHQVGQRQRPESLEPERRTALDDLPDPVGDRRVMVCLVLVEAQPVGAVIGVLAPAAAGEATFLPDTAADCAEFQEVSDDVAGELPPAVEGLKLFPHALQFAIAQHCNAPHTFTRLDAIERPMTPNQLYKDLFSARTPLFSLCRSRSPVPRRSECLCHERLAVDRLINSVRLALWNWEQGGSKGLKWGSCVPSPLHLFRLFRASIVHYSTVRYNSSVPWRMGNAIPAPPS